MAPFTVKEVHAREELDSLVELIWEGQYRPYMPSVSIFFPVDGYTPEARESAVAASKDKMWNDLQQSAIECQWIAVVDESTSRPVACALWQFYKGSPAPDGVPKLNFHWLPAGDRKEYCEHMMQQIMTPRCLWMHRPHGGVSNMVVHPDYRRQGIGSLLMQWGNKAFDERQIEGFFEATGPGHKLYEKAGYLTVMKIGTFVPPGKSLMWNRLAHDLGIPNDYGYMMWRPVNGDFERSKRQRPWQ